MFFRRSAAVAAAALAAACLSAQAASAPASGGEPSAQALGSALPAATALRPESPVPVAGPSKEELPSDPKDFEAQRQAALAQLARWFMDDSTQAAAPGLAFSPGDEKAYAPAIAELRALRDQAALLRKGRAEGWDDWPSYADMAVLVASRLGVDPPESALPVFRERLRDPADALTPQEEAVRNGLAADILSPDFTKRYLYISDLVGLPGPDPRLASQATQAFVERIRRGRRRIRKVVVRKVEVAPPPRPVSVIDEVDWDKADELAQVAGHNARNWDRKPRESLWRYRRRLRRLRKHCYASVRRDLTALGFWDARIFHGYVPPTRWDRKRPIRAASFALAMAKVEAEQKKNDPLADKTTLRQLNLRVDPLVRGSIVVFSQSVCGYDAHSGHIEIVTSVDPLRAASYKFHNVTTECLVRASNENKVHVYVPLRLDPSRRASNGPTPTRS